MKLPQLNLRDLFWLTTLVAVCVAWWLDRRTILKESKARAAALIAEINRIEFEKVQEQMQRAQSGWAWPPKPPVVGGENTP